MAIYKFSADFHDGGSDQEIHGEGEGIRESALQALQGRRLRGPVRHGVLEPDRTISAVRGLREWTQGQNPSVYEALVLYQGDSVLHSVTLSRVTAWQEAI